MNEKDKLRFLSKIEKTEDCWNWKGSMTPYGYGTFGLKGKNIRAHRLSYEHFIGKMIPVGLQIDHLCKNRKCVNPNHLEVVTLIENVRRGDSFSSKNRGATHCVNGHAFTGKNVFTITHKSGRDEGKSERACRECRRIRERKYYNERKLRTGRGHR